MNVSESASVHLPEEFWGQNPMCTCHLTGCELRPSAKHFLRAQRSLAGWLVVSFGPRPNSSEPAALRTVLASPLPVAPPSLVAPAHHLLPCFIERDLSARRPRLTLSGLLLASLSPLPPDPAHLGVIGSARAGAVWAQREAHSRLRTGSQFVDYNADPRFVAYLWLTRNKCW